MLHFRDFRILAYEFFLALSKCCLLFLGLEQGLLIGIGNEIVLMKFSFSFPFLLKYCRAIFYNELRILLGFEIEII